MSNLHGLWFHYGWPSLVGNGPEDVISLIIVGGVGSLLWPRTRQAIGRFAQRHLQSVKDHAAIENALLHRKLDHIIKHHPAIPPFITSKGTTQMSLLDTIESRFTGVAERVVTDAEKAAHSRIAQTLIDAAKVILPLLPEGGEVELVLSKLQEAEAWAHRALAVGGTVVAEAATVTADAAATVSTTSPPEAAAPLPAPSAG